MPNLSISQRLHHWLTAVYDKQSPEEVRESANSLNSLKENLLHDAIYDNLPIELFRLLVESGCDINKKNKRGASPWDLTAHSMVGFLEKTDCFLNSNWDVSGLNRELLTSSVMNKCPPEFLERFIKKGWDINKSNALIYCLCEKQEKHFETLLELGVKFDFSKHPTTPLHKLCDNRSPSKKIFEVLIKKIDINSLDDLKRTPLFYASCKKDVFYLNKLLEKGASVNVQDVKGNTPLHLAMKNQRFGSIEILFQNGANPYLKNKSGRDAFDYCADEQMTSQMVQLYLKHKLSQSEQLLFRKRI